MFWNVLSNRIYSWTMQSNLTNEKYHHIKLGDRSLLFLEVDLDKLAGHHHQAIFDKISFLVDILDAEFSRDDYSRQDKSNCKLTRCSIPPNHLLVDSQESWYIQTIHLCIYIRYIQR